MNVFNTQYNKAVYGTFAGAVATLLFYILAQFGIELDAETKGSITTIIVGLIVYFVPNTVKADQ